MRVYEGALAAVLALSLTLPVFAQQAGRSAAGTGRAPGDAAALEVLPGPGRAGHAPDTDLGFARDAQGETSPAFEMADTQALMQRVAVLKPSDPQAGVPAIDSPANVGGRARRDRDAKRCLESTCRQVPRRETLTAIGLGTPYARAITGGFEQGAGIDGGAQLTSASAIPAVELRATALTSIRWYRRVDLEAFLPNIGGSRNHADVWFSHLQRQTNFFGIGPRTAPDLETPFALTQRSYQGSLYRDLADDFRGGIYLQVMDSRSSRGKDTTLTPIDERFSGTSDPLPARWIPGFMSTTRTRSYGGFLAYDTRDNSIGLTRGVNMYGRVASASGLGRHDSVAYGWIEAEFDVRGYVPLGTPRTSLLLRSRGQFKAPKDGGRQIPFYDLSWLGGRMFGRGYDSYRFRANNVWLLSTELQQTVHAITAVRGVDVFASSDAGQVWGDARSSTDPGILDNQDFRSGNWHASFGGGLQYRHSRSLAARVEVSRSPQHTLVYWSLSRGF